MNKVIWTKCKKCGVKGVIDNEAGILLWLETPDADFTLIRKYDNLCFDCKIKQNLTRKQREKIRRKGYV